MGTITLNGIEYASTKTSAQQISYNSSESGLSSTNAQGVDQLLRQKPSHMIFLMNMRCL